MILNKRNQNIVKMQFECSNEEEHIVFGDRVNVVNESNRMWLKCKLDEMLWTDIVINKMNMIYPTSWRMACLFCLCHKPILLKTTEVGKKQYRIVSYTHTGNYLWPKSSIPKNLLQTSECSIGYHEENIVCLLIQKIYMDRKSLELDIEYIFDMSLHKGYLSSTVEYLYTHHSCSLPNVIQLALSLPLEEAILKSIELFGIFILHSTKCNLSKADGILTKLLSVNIRITSKEEWETIMKCRKGIGLHVWDKKPIKDDVTVSFQDCTYRYKWKMVSLIFDKKTYFERSDERLQWISIWFRFVTIDPVLYLNTAPKHLLSLILPFS
jgi:hypothetical protein